MAGNSKQRGGDDAEETVCCVSKRSIRGLPMTRTAMLLSPQLEKVAHEHKSVVYSRDRCLGPTLSALFSVFPVRRDI